MAPACLQKTKHPSRRLKKKAEEHAQSTSCFVSHAKRPQVYRKNREALTNNTLNQNPSRSMQRGATAVLREACSIRCSTLVVLAKRVKWTAILQKI